MPGNPKRKSVGKGMLATDSLVYASGNYRTPSDVIQLASDQDKSSFLLAAVGENFLTS